MQYNFIADLHKYQLTHFGVGNNTASKYAQSLKEILIVRLQMDGLPTTCFHSSDVAIKIHPIRAHYGADT
ncbi:hypothetical protein [Pinibacter soli]|uniref:Uncharacterized protein n=1 Tax=Pinibacter soli TaxID=3044211 RepID=A0ABT6RHU9_9BACT|nr:hypothetical protein [Pinibacter soli]MDI3321434.1 hypothetical protein [Pinibacter soli]